MTKPWSSVDKLFYQLGHLWLEEKKAGETAQWLRRLLYKHRRPSFYPRRQPQSTTVVWSCNLSVVLGWGWGLGWQTHWQASFVKLWRCLGSLRDPASTSKLDSGGRRHLILTSGSHTLMSKSTHLDTHMHICTQMVILSHIHTLKKEFFIFLLFKMFIPIGSYI